MAGPDRRSSIGVDRRASTRSSLPPQHQQLDNDDGDDDYDLAAMGISDGFRPSGAMTGHNRMPSQASRHIASGRRTPPPRPSSTTKPQVLDTFALRHDGGMGANVGRSSMVASNFNHAPTRSSSVSTDVPYIRAESPYRGPTGPSHPYQMYPQESRLARTASMATTSTVQVPDRPYNGPGGPTHPYGMYPQNTVPEAETVNEGTRTPPVPVGFPGLNNDYQRRLGPEGEEIADIIGPDGHTEQLPPYTQYPDEAFARKTRPTVAVPLAGAGGIGLATRNPEFSSREDLSSPSRQSTRSFMSDQSNHQVNTAAAVESEKPPQKKWQQVARRKVCGIVPVWVLVLVVIVFIMFGIILGTVLAVLKPKHGPKHYPPGKNPQSIVVTTMTTTFDATPLTTSPTSLPTLPTGTYALPISAPSAIQNSCLSNTQQSAAWTCQIPMTSYTIVVTPLAGATSNLANNEVSLSLGNNTFGEYYAYGTQPPVLNQYQVLNLVTDSQEPGRGPAWFFEMPYNKVVILPEAALAAPTNSKRGNGEKDHPPESFMRKNVAQPGDRPWFCYWNGTLLEAFIYVNLTSSAGQSAAASSPASTTAAATSTYGSVPTSSVQSSAASGTSQQFKFPPAYPKVLKIEERRVPGPQAIPPYCVQHQIDNYGAAQVALNSTNQPVIVYLNETEATTVSQMESKRGYGVVAERDSGLIARQTGTVSCGCVWLWT